MRQYCVRRFNECGIAFTWQLHKAVNNNPILAASCGGWVAVTWISCLTQYVIIIDLPYLCVRLNGQMFHI